jgi:type VI secretion system protein ImpM
MSDETLASGTIGWYGKLPVAGDFLRHGLPDAFVSAWDEWLSQGMAAAAQEHGDEWHEVFLCFPVWHFLRKLPQADAGSVWAGVLVPGVDRVGRLFPLTVAFAMPDQMLLRIGLMPVESRLDAIALHVLDVLGDDNLPQFEEAMKAMPPLQAGDAAIGEASPHALVLSLGAQALLERLQSNAIFWSTTGDPSPPLLLVPEPLEAGTFCRLVQPSATPILSD